MLSFYLALAITPEERSLIEHIYIDHKRTMMLVALEVLKDRDRAEDAVQQAFFNILQNFDKILNRSEEKVIAYLKRTTRNIALNEVRNEEAHTHILYEHCAQELSVEVGFYKRIEQELLIDAILALPAGARDLLELHIYHGCSIAEIARQTGDKTKTVQKRLERARNLLIQSLKEAME